MFKPIELTPAEKIIKAKIVLQSEKPFFGSLLLHMREQEDADADVPTLGVNKYGRLFFNAEYVDTLSPKLLKTAMCHEVMHIVLEHFKRVGKKDMQIFNIATDTAVNGILQDDGFSLSEGWIVPKHNGDLVMDGEVLSTDTKHKPSEQIYDDIYTKLKDKQKEGWKIPNGQDSHMVDSEEGKEDLGENAKDDKTLGDYWRDIVVESCITAKQKGKIPSGMDRFVKELLNPKLNWKHILHREVSNSQPFDFSWKRPSKRSYGTGFYMPKTYCENVEVLIHLDTSGSMNNRALSQMKSELVSMARSFPNINMTIILGDIGIHKTYHIANGNIAKIMAINMKGGGGTSHTEVFNWVAENKPNSKLLICFTDGYTDFPEKPNIRTLWILAGRSISPSEIPFGQVIKMREED